MSPRRPSDFERERVVLTFDHPQVTGDTTYKIWQAPRPFVVVDVRYINPTGLVGDNTNAFAGFLKNGSNVVATLFNTDTNDSPAGASLAADTWVEGTISATYARGDADDVLSLLLDEDGAATLPAGRLVVEVIYP